MRENNFRGSRTVSLEQVLEFLRYSIPRNGVGYCPICRGPEFSMNRKTQSWQCASQCGGGDVIDLLMKRMDINKEAAALAYSEMTTAHGPLWWDAQAFKTRVAHFPLLAKPGTTLSQGHSVLGNADQIRPRSAGHNQPKNTTNMPLHSSTLSSSVGSCANNRSMPDQSQKNYPSMKDETNPENKSMNTVEKDSKNNKIDEIKTHISNLWNHLHITPMSLISLLNMNRKDQESEIFSKIVSDCFEFFDSEDKAKHILYAFYDCQSALDELPSIISHEVAGILMEKHITRTRCKTRLNYLWLRSQGFEENSPEFVSLLEKIDLLDELVISTIKSSRLPQETQN